MLIELLTKAEFDFFKTELFQKIDDMKNDSTFQTKKKWLRSREVQKLLSISSTHLSSMRNKGFLTFTKVDRTIYYDYDEILKLFNSGIYTAVRKV